MFRVCNATRRAVRWSRRTASAAATTGRSTRTRRTTWREEARSGRARGGAVGAAVLLVGGAWLWTDKRRVAHAQSAEVVDPNDLDDDAYELYWQERVGRKRDDLPTYTVEQLQEHTSVETRIWVAYKNGIYDITEWVQLHPGGSKKILTAAGRSLEPFWNMYGQHISGWVYEILESYRIGNIDATEMEKMCLTDPYCSEPPRDNRLIVHAEKPFNAEPPRELLIESFITPNELFYVRNHLPVPVVDPMTFKLDVDTGDMNVRFTMDELKEQFEPISYVSAIQCAGNRRSGLNEVKPVKGGMWEIAAISNAEWRGVRLRDVMKESGGPSTVNEALNQGLRHTHFIGLDLDESGTPYAASVPTELALAERGGALLAFEMNGEQLTPDHGWPLRAIIPGVAGARQVKWLGEVRLSAEESDSHWQQRDYKGFSPNSSWDKLDWSSAPAIQKMPVQSAICWPSPQATVETDLIQAEGVEQSRVLPNVRGYAYSGAGADIARVDVSGDGGKTWHVATLEKEPQRKGVEYYGWRRWRIDLELPKDAKEHEICVKAIDSSYNTQPGESDAVWNYRGLLNNSWHRVKVVSTDKTQ